MFTLYKVQSSRSGISADRDRAQWGRVRRHNNGIRKAVLKLMKQNGHVLQPMAATNGKPSSRQRRHPTITKS
jgi:hypothetical protein